MSNGLKTFQVNLYKKGKICGTLKGDYPNRHHLEEIARREVAESDADSMGAIDEVNTL